MKFSASELAEFCDQALVRAKQLGATSAEVGVSTESGLDLSVRMGEVENVEHHQNQSLSLTVYIGKKTGSASTSDLSADALSQTVDKAITIAKQTQEDPFAGLADPDQLACEIPNCDLDYPWDIPLSELITKAIDCEARALGVDPRISNSDGVGISTGRYLCAYANTDNFYATYPRTVHHVNCTLVAKEQGQMQRDGDYTIARDPTDLLDLSSVADKAAQKTLRRLGSQKISTTQVPVIFHADLARGFWGHLFSAISGSAIYKKASFLSDKLNQKILPDFITLTQQPHLLKGLASAPFDDEGVATEDRQFVAEGVLSSYLMGSYSARKLGLKSTGNAGGLQNLIVTHADLDLAALCRKMGKGFLVTELIGQGVNIVTGDYSRGAFGFWVENGEIQYPVEGVTLAGNLSDLYLNLVAVGNDVDTRGTIQTGSVLLDQMTLAGQ